MSTGVTLARVRVQVRARALALGLGLPRPPRLQMPSPPLAFRAGGPASAAPRPARDSRASIRNVTRCAEGLVIIIIIIIIIILIIILIIGLVQSLSASHHAEG